MNKLASFKKESKRSDENDLVPKHLAIGKTRQKMHPSPSTISNANISKDNQIFMCCIIRVEKAAKRFWGDQIKTPVDGKQIFRGSDL